MRIHYSKQYAILALAWVICITRLSAQGGSDQEIWLSDLDLTKMSCAMGVPKTDKSIVGGSLRIGGENYEHGVGTHASSRMLIQLNGMARYFKATVGLDDAAYKEAAVSFYVLGDKKILWESGICKRGDKPKEVNIQLTGIRKLGLLVMVNREDISENYADWAGARIVYSGKKPFALSNNVNAEQYGMLTPPAPEKPVINGPAIYGVRPGSPFLYKVPITGKRPVSVSADHLPRGLSVDHTTGIISGVVKEPGYYRVTLTVKNQFGKAKKEFAIVAGSKLALTPPMGWNSWYNYYCNVSDSVIRAAADAMISSGMADYGYQYISIDDCWMNNYQGNNQGDNNSMRDNNGRIRPNQRFPDMEALTAFIHKYGLKAGIYSSPGPKTCAGGTGSYTSEITDALTFAQWGFDFLKYDWCSYGSVIKTRTPENLKAPFALIDSALRLTGRDIVLNLCQYGMGKVWEWGAQYGHSWRTGPDLGTASGSFIPGFYSQGLLNAEHWQYAGPGAWNDPDYINIGWVGTDRKDQFRKTSLTPNEQYAYMTMWSLMSSPLFFSGNMSMLDSFTLNILCNAEVIAVNQDSLGLQARIVRNDSSGIIMLKKLADGSWAAGLFNFPGRKDNPADYFAWADDENKTRSVRLALQEFLPAGSYKIRNLWTQREMGVFQEYVDVTVPYHAAVLLKISPLTKKSGKRK